jgi:hypothetical protein
LKRYFLVWCQERRLRRLDQIRAPHLREFRRGWDLRCTTAGRGTSACVRSSSFAWTMAGCKSTP